MKKLLQEFKAFAMKGSVIDMAVGIIIGGGFGKVVASLVSDVIMPPIGLLIGGVNFTELKAVLNPHKVKEGVEAVTLNYGMFIQTIIDFTIIAFSIFMVIRLINKLHNMTKKKEDEVEIAPPAAPEPTKEEILLTEIRDLLKSKN